jgi:hypothetical protein
MTKLDPEAYSLGHHGRSAVACRTAIRAAGASLLFLPSYSPDLNPIEQAFANLKATLSCKRSPALCRPSQPENAPTTSGTQDMLQCRVITL